MDPDTSTLNRPLRFLHLTTFYPPFSFGGDGVYVQRLAHALSDAGHSVDVVHSADAYRLLHADPPRGSPEAHPGVRVHPLSSRAGPLATLLTHQTGRPLLYRRRIRKILDAAPYDVIHYHNVSLLGPGVLMETPGAGRALKLYTAHEHWLVCPMHVLWKFNRRPCESPECLRCVLRGRRPPQYWRYTTLLERASRHVDEFVAPSRFASRMHAERGFARPLACLPYFQDRVDHDWRTPGPRPHERPYFLFVGRLEPIKGVQDLVELWREVADQDLLIAGDGSIEKSLRALAAGNPRVRFLGAVPQSEIGRLYYHAIACVVPSVTFETFGLVVIEAYARKTPVIARNLGALPELIEVGGGMTFETRAELRRALDRLAGSPALRADLGERGYRAFLRLWSREAHLERYFEILDRVAVRKLGAVPWTSV
jgi:glycosyltransferase involved in cell wall biosynthesis